MRQVENVMLAMVTRSASMVRVKCDDSYDKTRSASIVRVRCCDYYGDMPFQCGA